MNIEIGKKRDRVIAVTSDFIAIEKENGELVIVPITKDDQGIYIELDSKITIIYGGGTIGTVSAQSSAIADY